ncbi:MAG: hypothetical protein LAT83_14340 [Kiritimatiellae bacterium]|nr:hypothetical protein [Kiritimatiellia bacterium]
MNEVAMELEKLCNEAEHVWQKGLSSRDFENQFVTVLNFLGNHSEDQPQLIKVFVKILEDKEFMACDLISFCMHQMRWKEIKEKALQLLVSSEDFREKQAMADIVASYENNWSGSDLYSYYKK